MQTLWGQKLRAALALMIIIAGDAIHADTLTLVNGDVLSGRIVEQTQEAVTLEHPVLGKVVIDRDRVQSVGKTPKKHSAELAEKDLATTPPAKPKADPKKLKQRASEAARKDETYTMAGFLREWKSRLTLGLNGASGNTDRQNYRVMFQGTHTEGRDRWDFNSRWVYAFANGRQNQNQFETNLTREWMKGDTPWFFFIKGQYKYDQRRSFQNRTSAFGGGGYTLANTDTLQLNTRLGFGGTYEYGSVNEFTPEALFGGSVVSWKVSERTSFAGESLFYPSLQDGNNYRIESSLEWVYKLDMAAGMSFKLGLENEYDSDARLDNSNNDLKYYGAIVLSF